MALVIYSGGLDSTVLLYKLHSEGRAKAALSVIYGQRHSKEADFAEYNCKKLGVPVMKIDITCIKPLFGHNALTDASVSVPKADYDQATMSNTVVPNRNMIFMALAAARAISLGEDEIAYAAHSGDHSVYPDCRPEFADAMQKALSLCHYTPVKLLRPFVNISKADIVRLGADLGVDFSKTWSCYEGGKIHCGKCGTCRERREAFKEAGVEDPTIYAD